MLGEDFHFLLRDHFGVLEDALGGRLAREVSLVDGDIDVSYVGGSAR